MSGLQIKIKAGATFEKSSVTATGQLVDVITDSERASFGIGSDADLKRAVEKYFGKCPNDAYLKSPTPWDDLYKRYGWPQVQTVLVAKTAKILEVTTKPTIVATKTLTNESSNTATFSTKIEERVENSVSSEWSNSHSISVEEKISFSINLGGVGSIGSETAFGFTQNWGNTETVSKQTSVGTETEVSVELKPGESAIVELSASSGSMRIQITYEAYLTGRTAINYNPKYKGHHFWALPIGDVVKTIGSKKVQIVEDIVLGFFSKAKATAKTAGTMERMTSHMADHPHEPLSQ